MDYPGCERTVVMGAEEIETPDGHASARPGVGFRVWGLGFRVQGAGCRVQGAGCRVQGAPCSVGRRHTIVPEAAMSTTCRFRLGRV